jgi:hypothetical protein
MFIYKNIIYFVMILTDILKKMNGKTYLRKSITVII